MLTAILTGIAFIIGAFFERIVFAVMILLLARSTVRALRKIKTKVAKATELLRAKATNRWMRFRQRVRFAFGPTVRIVA